MKVEFEIDNIGLDPIHNIFYERESLYKKLDKNRLLKKDRELLVEALMIITELYKNQY